VVVIDSNVFINALRGNPSCIEFIVRNRGVGCFSALTEIEILCGDICADRSEEARVRELLGQFRKVAVDNAVAVLAAKIEREHRPGLADATIAATALLEGGVLATNNRRHFKGIARLSLLAVK